MADLTGRELYEAIPAPYKALENTRVAGGRVRAFAEEHVEAIRAGVEPAQLLSFWEEMSRYSSLVDVEASRGKGALETAAAACSRFDAATPEDKQHELRGTRQAVGELLNFSRSTVVLEQLRDYAQRGARHGHGLPEAVQMLSALNSQLGALEHALEPYAATLDRGLEFAPAPDVTASGLPVFSPIEEAAAAIVETVIPAPSGPGYDRLAPDPRVIDENPWLGRLARKGIPYDQPVAPDGRPGLLPQFDGQGVEMITMSGRQISAAQSLDAGYGDELKIGDARVGVGSLTAEDVDADAVGYGYDRARG